MTPNLTASLRDIPSPRVITRKVGTMNVTTTLPPTVLTAAGLAAKGIRDAERVQGIAELLITIKAFSGDLVLSATDYQQAARDLYQDLLERDEDNRQRMAEDMAQVRRG